MAESKRIFNAGKMNRDLDDRLVQPGEYRDALNINIGRSEGSDVGAVENLKGNERITGQDNVEGTTIGYTRDQANNRIYWFTKGTTVDAIYEYDAGTGNVNTILKDSVARENVQPTCAPVLTIPTQDDLVSDQPDRPDLPDLPPTPIGGCGLSSATHTSRNGRFFPGTGDFRDDSLCVMIPAPPTESLGVSITGQGAFANTDSPVTLTAVPTEVLGTASFLWDTGETTSTLEVSGVDQTITGSVTVTDSGRTAPDNTATTNYSVTFQAAAPITRTYSHTPDRTGTIDNIVYTGTQSGLEFTEGVQGNVGYTIQAVPADGFQWVTPPTLGAAVGLPSTVTEGAQVIPAAGTDTGTSRSYSGTWTPAIGEDITATSAWTGGMVIEDPLVPMLTSTTLSPSLASAEAGIMNAIISTVAIDVETAPTSTSVSVSGTINGTTITSSESNAAQISLNDGVLLITYFLELAASGVQDGGGPIDAAGANATVINGITITLTGGSLPSPTVESFVESKFGFPSVTHTFPATLTTT